MDNRDKLLTRWIDGCLDPEDRANLEAEDDGQALKEKHAWEALRPTLQAHLAPPPMDSPDFFNARILESIEQDRKAAPVREAVSLPSLRRLIFAGLGSLAFALLMTLFFLPQSFQKTNHDKFMSQAISARTYDPDISVATFSAPDDRSLIVWVEGAPFIPPKETVR